jgi:hypothetical protein
VLLSSNASRQAASAHFLLTHTSPRPAYNLKNPRFLGYDAPHFNNFHRERIAKSIGVQTARGGQAVEVTAPDGSHYMLRLSYTSNTLATNVAEGTNGQLGVSTADAVVSQVSMQNANYPQPIGTVRAYPMPGGRVGIIVDGTTDNVELSINPLGRPQLKGFAHSFAYGEATRSNLLNIGQLTVNSGYLAGVLGFHTAVLSGPLVIGGTTAVDRIALDAMLPGASIQTGGDLNTLDVLSSINLSGPGTGIFVGRDLNLLNSGSSIVLSNGANIMIGRDLGLVNQPPKGTGTGTNVLLLNFNTITSSLVQGSIVPEPVSTFIQGNVVINAGSEFGIQGFVNNGMYIEGSLTGYSRMFEFAGTNSQRNPPLVTPPIPGTTVPGEVNVLGGVTP